MGNIDYRNGQIVERKKGFKNMYYAVGSKNKKYLIECLRAHELIFTIIKPSYRETITGEEMRGLVLSYVNMDIESRKVFIGKIAEPELYRIKSVPLEKLLDTWYEYKKTQIFVKRMFQNLNNQRKTISEFFNEMGLKTTTDLKQETAIKYMEWRERKTYNPGKKTVISASILKHELQCLKQMNTIGYENDWMPKDGIWNRLKVKHIVGYNQKVVEPLNVEEQKAILETLKKISPRVHDCILFILLTGIRVSELDILTFDSLQNNIIQLHKNAIGNIKTTGKTSSATRNLPTNPTILELFDRGFIVHTKSRYIKAYLQRPPFINYHKGIHPHRLRHSFAVNNLLSQKPLQMVSYQLGHSTIGLTADLYGKFEPTHFKVGFEEAIKERKEWLDFLENHYFD